MTRDATTGKIIPVKQVKIQRTESVVGGLKLDSETLTDMYNQNAVQ